MKPEPKKYRKNKYYRNVMFFSKNSILLKS